MTIVNSGLKGLNEKKIFLTFIGGIRDTLAAREIIICHTKKNDHMEICPDIRMSFFSFNYVINNNSII